MTNVRIVSKYPMTKRFGFLIWNFGFVWKLKIGN